MIFKRREKRSLWARLRDIVQPRKGWRRGFRYIGRRVQRLPDTPHRIALGFACGGLASFTPFFTLHALAAVALAWVLRANILASVFGTIVGNPISFPFIAAISLQLGNWMLGRLDGAENLDALSFEYVWNQPLEFLDSIFTPYLIGGLIPGLICAAACYFGLRPIVARFQERRRRILSARARTLLAERRAARRAAKAAAERAKAGPSEPERGEPGAGEARRGASDAASKVGEAGKSIERLSAALPKLRRPRPAGETR
ncbi:MAG: DUF2062 domain-containing protein [Pseudomonadota bacterium]